MSDFQCPACGHKIGTNGDDQNMFCWRCGSPMKLLAPPTPTMEPLPEPIIQPVIEQAKAEPEQTDGKADLTFSVEETANLNAEGVFVYISPKGRFFCRYGESEVVLGKKYRHLEPLSLAELEALGVTAIEETYNAKLEDQPTDIMENEPEPEMAKEADSEDKITFEE